MKIGSINDVASTLLSGEKNITNGSYESSSAVAEAANFESVIKDVTRKAEANAQSNISEAERIKRDNELKEACKGFESMFLSLMYKSMRATVPENTLFGSNNGQKIFQDMYDQKLMESVADSESFGIAKLLYKQLSSQTEDKKENEPV